MVECCESDTRGSQEGDPSRLGVCPPDTQDRRCSDGPQCTHHHCTRRVGHPCITFTIISPGHSSSITTHDCRHLIIDAGHIAIESQLANKKAIQEINAKRKQQYTDEDYKRLESMMYDRLSVRLEAAQVWLGSKNYPSSKALFPVPDW